MLKAFVLLALRSHDSCAYSGKKEWPSQLVGRKGWKRKLHLPCRGVKSCHRKTTGREGLGEYVRDNLQQQRGVKPQCFASAHPQRPALQCGGDTT